MLRDGGLAALLAVRPQPVQKAAQMPRAAQIQRLEELLNSGERSLKKAFLESVNQIRDSIKLAEVTRLLERGDTSGAMRYLDRVVPGFYERVSNARNDVFMRAGRSAAGEIGENMPLIMTQFDIANTRAVDKMNLNRGRLIRELTEKQREATYQAIMAGINDGKNPRDIARDFRDSIGLTRRQELAVRNYRRALETGDISNALGRQLRDRRFDSTVLRLGDKMPKEKVAQLTDRYRERYIKYRSETIARTEALRSVNEASQEMWEQAVDDPTNESILKEETIVRKWITAKDHRVRDAHRMIPMLNSKGRGLREPFITPLGPLMFPGDPSGLPGNVIQCRCVVVYEVDPSREGTVDGAVVEPEEVMAKPKKPKKKPKKKTRRLLAPDQLPNAGLDMPDRLPFGATSVDWGDPWTIDSMQDVLTYGNPKKVWRGAADAINGKSDGLEFWDNSYRGMGRYLRGRSQDEDSPVSEGQIRAQVGFDKSSIEDTLPTDQHYTLFRTHPIFDNEFGDRFQQFDEFIAEFATGEYSDKSFLSTTFSREFIRGWAVTRAMEYQTGVRNIMFQIEVPKGSRGVAIAPNEGELEMTFKPNAKFEIIKYTDPVDISSEVDGKVIFVKMRYIDDSDVEVPLSPAEKRRDAAARAVAKHITDNDPLAFESRGVRIAVDEVEAVDPDDDFLIPFPNEKRIISMLKEFDTDELEAFVPGYKYLDTDPLKAPKRPLQSPIAIGDFRPGTLVDDVRTIKRLLDDSDDEEIKTIGSLLLDDDRIVQWTRDEDTAMFSTIPKTAHSQGRIDMDKLDFEASPNSFYRAALLHEFGHFVDSDPFGGDFRSEVSLGPMNRDTLNFKSDASTAREDKSIENRVKEMMRKPSETTWDGHFANEASRLDERLGKKTGKEIDLISQFVRAAKIDKTSRTSIEMTFTAMVRLEFAISTEKSIHLDKFLRLLSWVAENPRSGVHLMIPDYFGSLTRLRIGFGHSKEYYESDEKLYAMEAFANYFMMRANQNQSGLSKFGLNLARHFTPETAKSFDAVLTEQVTRIAANKKSWLEFDERMAASSSSGGLTTPSRIVDDPTDDILPFDDDAPLDLNKDSIVPEVYDGLAEDIWEDAADAINNPQTILNYWRTEYREMSSLMRYGITSEGRYTESWVRRLIGADQYNINERTNPTEEHYTVFRTHPLLNKDSVPDKEKYQKLLEQFATGEYIDKGFGATSFSPNFSWKWMRSRKGANDSGARNLMFQIEIHKGSRGVAIADDDFEL